MSRNKSNLEHISILPTKDGGKVQVFVRKANKNVLKYWHSSIQPLINTSDEARADKQWNWPRIVTSLSITANLLQQKPICYTIGLKVNDKFLPCALVFLAENYPYFPERAKSSSFIWFMAAAPKEFYYSKGYKDLIPKLGLACLDIGVTASFHNDNNGLMELHASPRGKDKLLKFYKKLGMLNFDIKKKVTLARKNDGRYFYYDEHNALKLSQQCDTWRNPKE